MNQSMKEFSQTKILLVNSAEAYISRVATHDLKGKQQQEFDKLSIIGKFLFMLRLLKFKGGMFTPDKNPLQSFTKLVEDRNKLVHFKAISFAQADKRAKSMESQTGSFS